MDEGETDAGQICHRNDPSNLHHHHHHHHHNNNNTKNNNNNNNKNVNPNNGNIQTTTINNNEKHPTTMTTTTAAALHRQDKPNILRPAVSVEQHQPHLLQPKGSAVPAFRHTPVFTTCPECQYEIVTSIHFESGSFTITLSCLSAVAGCFLGCCLIPFFIDGCKDVVHTCPKCLHTIAKWTRI